MRSSGPIRSRDVTCSWNIDRRNSSRSATCCDKSVTSARRSRLSRFMVHTSDCNARSLCSSAASRPGSSSSSAIVCIPTNVRNHRKTLHGGALCVTIATRYVTLGPGRDQSPRSGRAKIFARCPRMLQHLERKRIEPVRNRGVLKVPPQGQKGAQAIGVRNAREKLAYDPAVREQVPAVQDVELAEFTLVVNDDPAVQGDAADVADDGVARVAEHRLDECSVPLVPVALPGAQGGEV